MTYISYHKFLDELTLPVESGEYNIRTFKEIDVTDSYLGIDENIRGCQDKVLYDECIQNSYEEKIKNLCGCLPLPLNVNQNVVNIHHYPFDVLPFLLQDEVCEKSVEANCVALVNLTECKRYFLFL